MGGVGVWVGGHVGVGVVRVAWWVCLDEWGGGETADGLSCGRSDRRGTPLASPKTLVAERSSGGMSLK